MSHLNRRDFIKASSGLLIGLTAGGLSVRAHAQEKISLDDPTAKALNYVHETPKEDQDCANCLHIGGEEGQEWRPCAIFQNKLVKSQGWCKAWVVKPG